MSMSKFRRRLLESAQGGGGLPAGTTFDFPYTGTVQEITLPKGVYLLECWGAQGGGFSVSTIKMNGGYSSGCLSLKSRTVLFVFVGGAGKRYMDNNQNTIVNGGWNGGGGGRNFIDYGDYYFLSGSGGGATDISLVSSSMDYVNGRTNRSKESLLSRIIVAGGGSGGGEYNSPNQSLIYEGSHGGGVSGGGYYPGTQNAATGGDAGFGYGSNITGRSGAYFSAGGGGGWYGGGYQPQNSWWSVSTSGGSGFVNVAANAQYRPEGYTGLELESGQTIAGNTSFPSVDGGTETGHSGNGYARITVVGS